MDREELTKLKEDIYEEIKEAQLTRTKVTETSDYIQSSIAISNLYIALSNLV